MNNNNVDGLIQQAALALKAGRKAEARAFLDRAVEIDERSEQGWLWMSGVVDTDEERLICLENVLTINPGNQAALKGVAALQKKMGRVPVPARPPAPAAAPVVAPDWWTSPPARPTDFQSGNNDSLATGPFSQGNEVMTPEEEDLEWDGIEAKGTNPSPFDSGFFRRPSPYLPTTSAEAAAPPESDPFGLKRRMAAQSPAPAAPARPAITPPSAPSQRAAATFSDMPPTPAPDNAAAKADRKSASEIQFDWNALDKVDLPPSQTALFTTVTSKASTSMTSPALRMSSIPAELRRTTFDPILLATVVVLAVLSLISLGLLIHTLTTR